jgi:hypothetical protein
MRFADVVPDFAAEVASALESEGFGDLRAKVYGASIERWTWDSQVNAGYVYVTQVKPLHQSETPAVQTIPFAAPHWFNVDLRHDGEICGIELLGRREIIERIEKKRAP